MKFRVSLTKTSSFCMLVISLSVLPNHSHSDSIKVGDKKYDNVYIRESSSTYYIHDPANGKVLSVSKKRMGVKVLDFSQEDEREKLWNAYEEKKNQEISKPNTQESPTIINPRPNSQTTQVPNHYDLNEIQDQAKYKIEEIEDISYRDIDNNNALVPRRNYRVRVQYLMSKGELTTISKEIINEALAQEEVKAVVIFYYLPESDIEGGYTVGKATWAPGGDWSLAATNIPPKLFVDAGNATGMNISNVNVVELPISTKKEMFWQLVRYQDQGMEPKRSYEVTSKQFGISEEQLRNISLEAHTNGWPMPEYVP